MFTGHTAHQRLNRVWNLKHSSNLYITTANQAYRETGRERESERESEREREREREEWGIECILYLVHVLQSNGILPRIRPHLVEEQILFWRLSHRRELHPVSCMRYIYM